MNLHLLPIVNKARRPKFEVHLKIYDLNNVPLVHGSSHIKWHLPHSIHTSHHGRTPKCPIANHRVEYNYGKIIPVRLAIDKNNNLAECPIELEVLQEFPIAPSSSSSGPGGAGGGGGNSREERITLGRLTLNLAEYVEESEAFIRDSGFRPRPSGSGPSFGGSGGGSASTPPKPSSSSQTSRGHSRKRSSLSTTSPVTIADTNGSVSPKTSTDSPRPPSIGNEQQQQQQPQPQPDLVHVEDGVIRRYLMTDSKINSTLKIGILMLQLDGERNYVAPPLKTAPVFGGITGMGITGSSSAAAGELTAGGPGAGGEFGLHFQDAHPEHDAASLSAQFSGVAGANPASDIYELQDMYRRALAASWAGHPGELAAGECIEDIFQGGDGFGSDGDEANHRHGPGDVTPRGHGKHGGSLARGKMMRREDSESSTGGASDDFLRPGDFSRRGGGSGAGGWGGARRQHARHGSGESVGALRHDGGGGPGTPQHRPHRRDGSRDSEVGSHRGGGLGMRGRSESLTSLANTIESERGRSGFKRARELNEWEVRDNLVAWKLPGTAS